MHVIQRSTQSPKPTLHAYIVKLPIQCKNAFWDDKVLVSSAGILAKYNVLEAPEKKKEAARSLTGLLLFPTECCPQFWIAYLSKQYLSGCALICLKNLSFERVGSSLTNSSLKHKYVKQVCAISCDHVQTIVLRCAVLSGIRRAICETRRMLDLSLSRMTRPRQQAAKDLSGGRFSRSNCVPWSN
jgi:hypothetical protein